jgi:Asp-tRNA(Asn)/Glu-tRNA(Gln) amidotransferase C subunit
VSGPVSVSAEERIREQMSEIAAFRETVMRLNAENDVLFERAQVADRLRAGVAALRSLVVSDTQFSRADVVRILNEMMEAM